MTIRNRFKNECDDLYWRHRSVINHFAMENVYNASPTSKIVVYELLFYNYHSNPNIMDWYGHIDYMEEINHNAINHTCRELVKELINSHGELRACLMLPF